MEAIRMTAHKLMAQADALIVEAHARYCSRRAVTATEITTATALIMLWLIEAAQAGVVNISTF